MTAYQAPAKLNLSLLVSPPRSDGYHPLESLVQTIEWCDRLLVEEGEGEDSLEVDGDTEVEGNLVLEALRVLRQESDLPPLSLRLEKSIPVAAGLGGGSSDAAAALRAGGDRAGLTDEAVLSAATQVGADVSLFLTGGSVMMRGLGHDIETVRPLTGFAVAVVVPDFGLSTVEVYRRWDELGAPEGSVVADDRLPPTLREGMPMRNDLLPAALDLEPRLGDFMADIALAWGAPVCLTGSGSACFGYFATAEEAVDAAAAVSGLVARERGVELRPAGVAESD